MGSSERTAPAELAAPPRQHVSAPGGALWATPLPAPVRVLTRPKPAREAPLSRVLLPGTPVVAVRRIAVPAVAKPKPVHRAAAPAEHAPAPTPDVAADPAPTPVPLQAPATPEPPRVLAATVATPATPAPAAKQHGNGRKLGHEQADRGKVRPDEAVEPAPAPPAPVPTPAPAPDPVPVAAPPAPAADAADADEGPGNGHGRGHAYGHSKTHGD